MEKIQKICLRKAAFVSILLLVLPWVQAVYIVDPGLMNQNIPSAIKGGSTVTRIGRTGEAIVPNSTRGTLIDRGVYTVNKHDIVFGQGTFWLCCYRCSLYNHTLRKLRTGRDPPVVPLRKGDLLTQRE